MPTVNDIRQRSFSLVLGDRDVEPADVTSDELSMMFLIHARLTGYDQARMRRIYVKISNKNPQAINLARAWFAEHIEFGFLVNKLAP